MCEKCKKPYYITTAIAYTSGKPHIGNTYEIVLADAIARYKRAEGYDVRFQTGTDEHGQKIEEKAQAAGITPQEFVDDVAGQIKTIWDLMNTSYDKFIRTTDEDHMAQVQKIFKKLYDKGDIYKGFREADNVKGCLHCPAHGINITQGIRRCDLPEEIGIIQHGRKEVQSLYHCHLVRDTVHRRVIFAVIPDEQVRIFLSSWKLIQHMT